MKKPRIIILMHYLELGGAEMALIGLLHAVDPEKVDVDLFIYSHQGPLMKFIPEWVNLLPEQTAYAMIERPIAEALKRGQFGVVAGRLLAKYKHRKYRRNNPANGDDAAIMQYIGDCVTPILPEINHQVEYDLCISFLTPHNIGSDKVKAKKRLAWIHTDYSTISINADQELPIWGSYDKIASISPEVTNSFLKIFPSLASKIIEIENILPLEYVKRRSEENDISGELTGKPNILSIGRYVYQKNFDNVPEITRLLVNNGFPDLKWYIIGFGGEESLIKSKIKEAGMEDHVILLGKKENPYPYIKACDIYVQPSRYEGKSVTVREAQMLFRPVAVTSYPTSASQIHNSIDGVIVPLDNVGASKGLIDFITDTTLQSRIKNYLQTHDYANLAEVEKIYSLLK